MICAGWGRAGRAYLVGAIILAGAPVFALAFLFERVFATRPLRLGIRRPAASRRNRFRISTLVGAIVLASSPSYALTITEVMYHPSAAATAAVGGRSLEWFELYNETPTTLNLSGYRVVDGVEFVFPHDTYLLPYSYLVVCADADAVREHYEIDNVIGNFTGLLDNGGEEIEVAIFGGGTEVRVDYSDSGQWPHAADGTGHSLSLKNVFADTRSNDSWEASLVLGGTPGGPNTDEPRVVDTILIDDDEEWRYRKGTSAYPSQWRNQGYDDGSWSRGRTGIGYGDGDDTTVLSDMSGGYWSFAARKVFSLSQSEIDDIDDLVFQINYDDGFAAFLNGTEVARGALPGASPPPHNQAADLHEAGGFEDFVIPTGLLDEGENVLAVQIHNNTLGSSDATFIPRLASRKTIVPTPTGSPVPVVINEFFGRADTGGWVELHNLSNASVDIGGFHLSTTRSVLDEWTIPAGTMLGSKGFVSFTAEETGLDFSADFVSVFFSRGDLSQVVDAQIFERGLGHVPSLEGYSEARSPDGTGRFAVSTMPTPGAANEVEVETGVVINEILYNPPAGREGQEFIEITNIAPVAIDLTGYRFNRGVTYEFEPGAQIQPGEFIVIARDPPALEAAHGIGGVLGPYEGGLSDGGERIRLVDPLGNIADEVRYFDGGEWSRWADGGGSSLELLDPRADNSLGSAWTASDESPKATWETVNYSFTYSSQAASEFHIMMLAAGEALIDDIEVRRSSTQYIANGSFESSTSGWIIEGNHVQSHRTTDDAFDGNACLRIVATGDGDTRVNRIERETSPSMSSGSYQVSLALKWQRGGNLIYFGNYNQLPSAQHTHWMEYPAALGTPGARNSTAVDNLGPVIGDVMHSPAVPTGGQPVQVVARVADADGIDYVRVRHRTGSASGSMSTVELFDDGAHGDGEAGDGIFGGEISARSSGNRVVYFIETRDDLGATWRHPVEANRTHVYVHDSPFAASSFRVRIVHDDATWNELNSRRLHSNELLDATFIFNESQVYYNVGTRFRGSPWNRPPSARMYRAKFPADRHLHGDRRAVNMSRYGNEHDERAAYYSVWRNSTPSSTSPMSRGSFARLKTNSRTDSMEMVDPVNRDYTRLWFPGDSDGIAYKITGKILFNDSGDQIPPPAWATYSNRGSNPASYRWNYNHRTRELENDYTPIARLMARINGGTTVLDETLEEIMDVEQFLRVYAARCAHDDWDTISIGNGQNAYFYWASNEGRMKLLPWDLDHSWGNTGSRIYPDADGSFARILARPKYRRMYWGILNEMVNGLDGKPGYWTASELVSKFIVPTHDVVGGDGVSSGSVSKVRNFINSRRGSLAGQLPAQREFRVTTADGQTVNDTEMEVNGEAWVDVHAIVVNGDPAVLSWPGTTRWRTTIPLGLGENELDFVAFDAEGNFIATDSITATSTAGWNPPEISAIQPGAAMPTTEITLTGTEFHDGIRVYFDGLEADAVVFDEGTNPSEATAVIPLIDPGVVAVTVQNVDGRTSAPFQFTVDPLPPLFVRGDANLSGLVEIGDPLKILLHLFAGVAIGCRDAADANNDEALDISDAMMLLEFQFQEGPAPSAPFPDAWFEPLAEGPLDCASGE